MVGDSRSPEVVQTPGWLSQLTHVLEYPEESGADPFDDQELREWARVRFECLAEMARPIEQLEAEPLGEVDGIPARDGMRLLGAMQDSLVLASVDEPEVRGQRADAFEILGGLVAARMEGVWEFPFGGSATQKSEQIVVSDQRLETRWGEIVQLIGPVAGTAARVYGELLIDGRELSEIEAATAHQQWWRSRRVCVVSIPKLT